jgi:tetratricopeptide (TPR) repeat protein
VTGAQDLLESLQDEHRDLFSRAVALCAVITTLVAAAVAFLHANASREGDRAAAAAQRTAIDAAHVVVKNRQLAQVELRRMQLGREYRAREMNALQRELLGVTGDSPLEPAEHWRELAAGVDRQLHRAARRTETPDISRGARASPERDPYFPSRLLAENERRGTYLAALRDARNELSSEWGKRGAIFIAILTLLAVALYLFGFSLTPQGRHMRGVFAAFGAVFLVVGVIFGPMQAIFPPSAAPDEAAQRYADARLAALTASRPAEYAAAVEELDEAIRLRPGFARAYLDRTEVRLAAASPQATSFLSLAPADVLKAGIRDLRKARELGLDTPSVAGNLAFELLALGLQTGRHDHVDESIELTQGAIEADRREPLLRFNLGAALLAAGRRDESEEAYRIALKMMIRQSNSSSRLVAARATTLRAGWVSGALTDLEMVARHRGIQFADDVRAMKELIVGSDFRGSVGPPRSKGFLAGVALAAGPGYLQFGVQANNRLPLRRAWLSTHWYRREPGLGWSHLEGVSGTCAHDQEVECKLIPGERGTYVGFVTYPDHTFPSRCLPPGEYRVELYDNGRLVGEAHGRSTERAFVGFRDKDAGVVGCRPRGWTASRLGGSRLIRGYADADRGSGLYVARLNNPIAAGGADTRAGLHAIERLLERVSSASGAELRAAPTQIFNFMELNYRTQVIRHFRQGNRHVLAGAGQDRDGSILVGLAVGSTDEYRQGRLRELLAALALGYDNPSISEAPATPDPTTFASQSIE